MIGVGGSNGELFLFTTGLSLAYQYDGRLDGISAITTTPMADSNGEWYFGASDGYVYDVEIPVSGIQLFKAARFGPGGSIASSPIVGACAAGPCMFLDRPQPAATSRGLVLPAFPTYVPVLAPPTVRPAWPTRNCGPAYRSARPQFGALTGSTFRVGRSTLPSPCLQTG